MKARQGASVGVGRWERLYKVLGAQTETMTGPHLDNLVHKLDWLGERAKNMTLGLGTQPVALGKRIRRICGRGRDKLPVE